MKKSKNFYRAEDIAKLTGLSRPTIYRYLKDGLIKSFNPIKYGKYERYLVRKEDLQEFINQMNGKTNM